MENKKNERELLRKQMELLAEKSKHCNDGDLPALTLAMVEVYKSLYWKPLQVKDN